MAIMNRLRRLFQADVHAVLDSVEEPQTVLKQALREMREALDLKRATLSRNQAALAQLKRAQASLNEALRAAEDDLAFALNQAPEELARKTVGRKLSLSKRLKSLQGRIDALASVCSRQSEEVEAQQAQLDSMQEKAREFVPIAADDSAAGVAESILSEREGRWGADVSEEEIELEWLRVQAARQGGES